MEKLLPIKTKPIANSINNLFSASSSRKSSKTPSSKNKNDPRNNGLSTEKSNWYPKILDTNEKLKITPIQIAIPPNLTIFLLFLSFLCETKILKFMANFFIIGVIKNVVIAAKDKDKNVSKILYNFNIILLP